MTERGEGGPNVIVATTVGCEREGRYFFDGVVARLLKQGKIPHSIDIALDGDEWSCLARLNYGGGSDGEAIFLPFEIESFALLWNASADRSLGSMLSKSRCIAKPARPDNLSQLQPARSEERRDGTEDVSTRRTRRS